MKHFLCVLVLAWFSCVAVTALAAESHAALIKSVNGAVHVTRLNQTFEVNAGATLQVSDRVVTAQGASAAIVFQDGTLLTLGSGADILVRDYTFVPKEGKFSFSVYLAKGSAIYESGKIGRLSPQSVKVETPDAAVGVRGTRFLIDAN